MATRRSVPRRRSPVAGCGRRIAAICFCLGVVWELQSSKPRKCLGPTPASETDERAQAHSRTKPAPVTVQVVYQLDETRPYALENFRFFLAFGLLWPQSDAALLVDYAVVINGVCSHVLCDPFVPGEREGAIVVLRRPNLGYDFGAYGDFLRYADQTPRADYYIFLNCGVRGPFLPPSLLGGGDLHWAQAFLAQMHGAGDVRLVGTSIVCLSDEDFCVEQDSDCKGPKVESFAFALEREALEHVLANGTSFGHYATKNELVMHGEYALSRSVLARNWGLAALLAAYAGVDWRRRATWHCNRHAHPSRAGKYGGISSHPFETMFHKSYWSAPDEPRVLQAEETRLTQWRYASWMRRLRAAEADQVAQFLRDSQPSRQGSPARPDWRHAARQGSYDLFPALLLHGIVGWRSAVRPHRKTRSPRRSAGSDA